MASSAAKHPIPDDWRKLQGLHMAEAAREEAKSAHESGARNQRRGRSVTADTVLAAAPPPDATLPREHDRQYRTMRSRGSAVPELDLTTGAPDTDADLLCALSASSADLTPGANARGRSGSTARVPSARPFSVMQASDDELDSHGLQAAIAAVLQEKERLVGQFEQLEQAVLAKSGTRGQNEHVGQLLGRNGSQMSRPADGPEQEQLARRRGSLSSSLFSQVPSEGGLPHQAGSANLSRRPSIASTALSSSASSQRTAISRDPLSSSSTSGAGLSSPPRVHARPSPVIGDEHEEKEVLEVKNRRQDVEERYSARLEYLEARLKSQLLKEKLAR